MIGSAPRLLPLCLAWTVLATLWPLALAARACAEEAGKPAAIELLPPTGPLAIGRTSCHWVDASREQPGAEPAAKCEVMAHIWYPAARQPGGVAAPYIPGFSLIQAALGEANLKSEVGACYDALSTARTHVIADADVSPKASQYPVILLTHGLRYHALGYSMLGEDLASHGYVVVGVDHPATAFAVLFPDQRVARFPEQNWSRRRTLDETAALERQQVNLAGADLVFVLNQLERMESGALPSRFQGRLDLTRVGVFGHSFGGRIAAKACQLDQRLKAGIICDGFGRTMTVDKHPDGSTLEQPMMVQYARRVPRAGFARILAKLQTPGRDLEEELRLVRKEFCESVKAVSYELTLSTPGIVHESFSDMPLLESGQDQETRKSRQRAIEITRNYTRAFFDRHLLALPAPLLDDAPENPDEVELIRHTFRGE